MSKLLPVGLILVVGSVAYSFLNNKLPEQALDVDSPNLQNNDDGGLSEDLHAFSIESLRVGIYPGSDLVIEETLDSGSSYSRYIASYKSEGLKINTLLTIPKGTKLQGGWPVIVFNHGYIPVVQHRTTEEYVVYVDGFARAG